jgi:sulfate transport system ATP-binding protein
MSKSGRAENPVRTGSDRTRWPRYFVTHDQEEALALADRVAIMGPQTPFVYDFLGHTNAFDCVVQRAHVRIGDKQFPTDGLPDGPAIAFVRPHEVVLQRVDFTKPSARRHSPKCRHGSTCYRAWATSVG